MCNSLSASTIFAVEICEKTFKIQGGSLNCGSQKALYLLKYKLYGKAPYIGKDKTKFQYMFSYSKRKHRTSRKGTKKLP